MGDNRVCAYCRRTVTWVRGIPPKETPPEGKTIATNSKLFADWYGVELEEVPQVTFLDSNPRYLMDPTSTSPSVSKSEPKLVNSRLNELLSPFRMSSTPPSRRPQTDTGRERNKSEESGQLQSGCTTVVPSPRSP